MHGSALLAAGALLCYNHDNNNSNHDDGDNSDGARRHHHAKSNNNSNTHDDDDDIRSTKPRKKSSLKRAQDLLAPYLEKLAASGVDSNLPTELLREGRVLEALFEVCVLPSNKSRDCMQAFLARGFGNSVGVGYALHDAVSRDVYAVARGCTRALRRFVHVGVTGELFASLQHVFLYAGQILPLILARVDAATREELCALAWRVSEGFVRSRSHYRSDEFMHAVPTSVFDATAARFFAFFRAVWPALQHHPVMSPGQNNGQNSGQITTVAMTHVEWLPALGRWGGISSLTVRRHWCECIAEVLRVINSMHVHAPHAHRDKNSGSNNLALTKSELAVFDKLLARKDLWTDEQLLMLGRELGQVRLGNLGASVLGNLPSRKRTATPGMLPLCMHGYVCVYIYVYMHTRMH
jgi:hypothetical protein